MSPLAVMADDRLDAPARSLIVDVLHPRWGKTRRADVAADLLQQALERTHDRLALDGHAVKARQEDQAKEGIGLD